MKQPTKVEATCEVCGGKFWRWRSQINHRGPARFCSRSCKDTARGVPFECEQCRSTVRPPPNIARQMGRGKYCSRECYYAHKRGAGSTKVTLTCEHCGEKFQRFKAWVRADTKFCSTDCAAAARGRGARLPRRGKAWRELAETIRDRDGRRCVRCSTPERPGPAGRLQVDHMVPARMLLAMPTVADDPANLASLCAPCHALKTHRCEPRLMRGDWIALDEFYGRDARERLGPVIAQVAWTS